MYVYQKVAIDVSAVLQYIFHLPLIFKQKYLTTSRLNSISWYLMTLLPCESVGMTQDELAELKYSEH